MEWNELESQGGCSAWPYSVPILNILQMFQCRGRAAWEMTCCKCHILGVTPSGSLDSRPCSPVALRFSLQPMGRFAARDMRWKQCSRSFLPGGHRFCRAGQSSCPGSRCQNCLPGETWRSIGPHLPRSPHLGALVGDPNPSMAELSQALGKGRRQAACFSLSPPGALANLDSA